MEIYSFINSAGYLFVCMSDVVYVHSALFAFELIGYNNRIGDFNLIDDFERSVIDMRSKCRLKK